jgi:hypothetical protein
MLHYIIVYYIILYYIILHYIVLYDIILYYIIIYYFLFYPIILSELYCITLYYIHIGMYRVICALLELCQVFPVIALRDRLPWDPRCLRISTDRCGRFGGQQLWSGGLARRGLWRGVWHGLWSKYLGKRWDNVKEMYK